MYRKDVNMSESRADGSLMLLKEQMTTEWLCLKQLVCGSSAQVSDHVCVCLCVCERGAQAAEGHHQMADTCIQTN